MNYNLTYQLLNADLENAQTERRNKDDRYQVGYTKGERKALVISNGLRCLLSRLFAAVCYPNGRRPADRTTMF
jgi:hypothetical protein